MVDKKQIEDLCRKHFQMVINESSVDSKEGTEIAAMVNIDVALSALIGIIGIEESKKVLSFMSEHIKIYDTCNVEYVEVKLS